MEKEVVDGSRTSWSTPGGVVAAAGALVLLAACCCNRGPQVFAMVEAESPSDREVSVSFAPSGGYPRTVMQVDNGEFTRPHGAGFWQVRGNRAHSYLCFVNEYDAARMNWRVRVQEGGRHKDLTVTVLECPGWESERTIHVLVPKDICRATAITCNPPIRNQTLTPLENYRRDHEECSSDEPPLSGSEKTP